MTTTQLPVRSAARAMSDELDPNVALKLAQDKREFVAWLQANVSTKSMRTLAIEAAAFHFAHQHLQLQLEQRLAEVEELYSRELKLREMSRQHRIRVAVDYKQMEVTLTQLDYRRAKVIQATGRLLQPQGWQELESQFASERLQLVRARLDHRRNRYLLRAATSDAADRAKLRAEFVANARAEFSDPSAAEEAIEEYDRTLFRFTGEGDER